MAEIYLNVCWGETPFTAEGWPAPLVRPEPYDAPIAGCPPVTIPDALMERYQAAEREFLAVQAELHVIAKENGDIG
jgi:hypothetical protein